MTESPWSKRPDDGEADRTNGETPRQEGGPSSSEDRRPLGPPSSSLPNVPDITPVAGTPIPPSPPSPPADGTVVMPATAAPPPMPSGPSPMPGDPAAAGPRYVVADRVPWYRTPDGRTRAGIGLGLATLILVGGIVWLASRGGDDAELLVSNESTTSTPGQFGAGLDTTTTDLAALPLDSTTTTSLVETTTTEGTTTTTSAPTPTLPAATTTTSTTTSTTTTTTSTTTSTSTTTTSTTTTTTTVAPLPEVVVPSSTSTIGEIIQASPGLADLDALMSSVGFYAELNDLTVPYTLFAPSNAALAAADLPTDTEAVRMILRRHVTTDGRFGSRQLFEQPELTMLDGSVLVVDATERRVGGALVVVVDKGGADTDQVLHVVDAVIDS